MAINLNTVKSVISKVNSKGVSLIRKEPKLKVSNAANEGLIVPEGAKTYDALRVGKTSKPHESYTDIFTFRNEQGQIINRYTKKVEGNNIIETHKGYEDLYTWEKDLNEFGDEIMEIPAKKISSYTRENGNITSIREDVFATTSEPKPYLTHFKREIKRGNEDGWHKRVNTENILIEQRRNGENVKFINNQYETDRFVNGNFKLIKSEATSPELDEIAQNSYLLPYISKNNKFANRMAQACIQDAKFVADPEVQLYKKASTRAGYYSDGGNLNINLKSSKDLAMPRESLTETIGHEVSHAKWDEKCNLYSFYEAGFDETEAFLKIYSKSEIPNIKKYRYSSERYIDPREDKVGYYNQFCEKVAREDGTKAVKKYIDLRDKIQEQFPNQHGFQFYHPNYNEDDLQGLFSMLKAW